MNKHKFAEVFTPPELVTEILSKINFEKIKRIYEPGVGKGAFLEQNTKMILKSQIVYLSLLYEKESFIYPVDCFDWHIFQKILL
jgi:type I restriction-modification system DNA methylase subunit